MQIFIRDFGLNHVYPSLQLTWFSDGFVMHYFWLRIGFVLVSTLYSPDLDPI